MNGIRRSVHGARKSRAGQKRRHASCRCAPLTTTASYSLFLSLLLLLGGGEGSSGPSERPPAASQKERFWCGGGALHRRRTMEGRDIYRIVTERIIEELEKGVIPWASPVSAHGLPK